MPTTGDSGKKELEQAMEGWETNVQHEALRGAFWAPVAVFSAIRWMEPGLIGLKMGILHDVNYGFFIWFI